MVIFSFLQRQTLVQVHQSYSQHFMDSFSFLLSYIQLPPVLRSSYLLVTTGHFSIVWCYLLWVAIYSHLLRAHCPLHLSRALLSQSLCERCQPESCLLYLPFPFSLFFLLKDQLNLDVQVLYLLRHRLLRQTPRHFLAVACLDLIS